MSGETTLSGPDFTKGISLSDIPDGGLVGGHVGHRPDLLLGDERAFLQATPGKHHVGDGDEPA